MVWKWNKVVALTRTVHIYLTMFAMLLMIFFAVTGLLLNHEDWITGNETEATPIEGTIPANLLAPEPDKLMIVEHLRNSYQATGAVSTFESDGDLLHLEMKGPGRHLEADINSTTGKMTLTMERRPFLVRMDDLHRGKDSGTAWSWIIDLSAVLLALGAMSGIILWIALPKRRRLGLIALGAGIAISVVVYFWMVP